MGLVPLNATLGAHRLSTRPSTSATSPQIILAFLTSEFRIAKKTAQSLASAASAPSASAFATTPSSRSSGRALPRVQPARRTFSISSRPATSPDLPSQNWPWGCSRDSSFSTKRSDDRISWLFCALAARTPAHSCPCRSSASCASTAIRRASRRRPPRRCSSRRRCCRRSGPCNQRFYAKSPQIRHAQAACVSANCCNGHGYRRKNPHRARAAGAARLRLGSCLRCEDTQVERAGTAERESLRIMSLQL